MSYFKNVKSFEDLKEQFKALARKNHPDCGGDAETMKAINAEYDSLFPIWKHRHNLTAAEPTKETADSTRTHFYTQNGWAGSKYDSSRSTKEVAALVRAYVKEVYPTYKFSVRYSHASMCSEVHVELVNAPYEIYKQFEELTDEERFKVWQTAERNSWVEKFGCLDDEHMAILKKAYEEHRFLKKYTEVVKSVMDDIDREVNSYRYDDSDGMIDYFHTNFYYFNVKLSDKFKVVEKTARIKNKPENTAPATADQADAVALPENEYEITESEHTKTHEKIFVVKVLRTLTREEYLQVKEYMKSLGGYYSKFVHGFVFKENPKEMLATA
ncbi:MAG: molecular chaperone DnaJ [Lachnospiraceae bacterium]|nr:molecular chaperone DnaJ [Lachnospiraceae bacterium]